MKDKDINIAIVGIIGVLALVFIAKKTPTTIDLTKALVAVDTIK
jgi:hypothetical protein